MQLRSYPIRNFASNVVVWCDVIHEQIIMKLSVYISWVLVALVVVFGAVLTGFALVHATAFILQELADAIWWLLNA